MDKKVYLAPLLALFFLFYIVPAVHSASIKEQMAARLPVINALKDQGKIGENNKGFLEYRSADKPQQNEVAAENSDRQQVYAAIGQKQGAPAALVGQRRAKMIEENGKKGHWFQSPDGTWYTK